MKRLSIAHLTALDMTPSDLAVAAAHAGFTHIGLRLHPAMKGGLAYPIRPRTQGFKKLQRVLHNEAVQVNDIEFVELTPDINIPSLEWLLEAGAELGASSLTVSGDDADFVRLTTHFTQLCDLAESYGIRINVEFMRWRHVADLLHAEALVKAAEQVNSGILVDALHLFRAGNTIEQLQSINPAWLADVQLCDAPLAAPPPNQIIQEAREGRLLPGDGALPLADLIAVLPQGVRYSVEVPVMGLGNEERIKRGADSVLSPHCGLRIFA